MGLVEGIVLIFATAATGVLGWCAKKVSDHDATDRELITKVGTLENSVTELRSETRESFIALENKVDQRFDRLNDKIDRVLEKV